MKLHKLSIQAFGPFANKETIDFSTLGDNPLFLIDGPTGAGKSSILHAICYALYGETTDEARKDSGVRCDHATDDTLTQITLEFSIRDQTYRITRTPTQMRKAKRGDGETEQKAEAHLAKVNADGEDETLVNKKKKEADEKIIEIIGLTAEQFRQVMVLPQGKFRELLLAKSDARQAILSTLFQTEIYKKIEQLLKDKASSIEREYKKFKEQILLTLQEVDVENNDELELVILAEQKRVSDFTTDKLSAEKEKDKAIIDLKTANQLVNGFKELSQKQATLTAHNQQQTHIENQKTVLDNALKANSLSPVWQQVCLLSADQKKQGIEQSRVGHALEQATLLATSYAKALDDAVGEYKGRDALVAQVSQLQGHLTLCHDFAALEIEASRASKTEQQSIEQHQLLQQKHIEFSERTTKGELYITHLQNTLASKDQLLLQQNQLQQQVKASIQVDTLNQAVTKQSQSVAELTIQHSNAHRIFLEAEQKANRIELAWHSDQVAVIAQTLTPEHPCPVCGSVKHPSPASTVSGNFDISKKAVDQARFTQQQSQKHHNDIGLQLNQATVTLNAEQQQLQNYQQELSQWSTKATSTCQHELAEINKQLSELELTEKKLEPAKQKLLLMVNELEPIQLTLDSLAGELPKLSQATVLANTALESVKKSLPEQYRTVTNINSALSQFNDQINKLDTSLKVAQQNHASSETSIAGLTSQLNELQKVQKQLDERFAKQSQDFQQALIEKGFSSQESFEQACLTPQQVLEIEKMLQTFEQTKLDLQSHLALLTEQLKDAEQPDVNELNVVLANTEAHYKTIEATWAGAKTRLSKLDDIKVKIARMENEQATQKERYNVIGTLAGAAGGKGNVRVSLERFVLGDLLDSVLSIASKRLYIMSKGQYQLVRQNEDLQKKNVTAGLDLAIDDAYTGKTRPVATLSGGESFLASLALALALSDVVQQRSGGIQLDTLFIDEGFGSLDQESLQLAIQTLIDLQASGRTIGIISHVSELKEQMALRVDVQNSRNGSTIKINNGL